jgi:hypothetical protein
MFMSSATTLLGGLMVDLRLDSDVSDAIQSGVDAIADGDERDRVNEFLRAVNANRAAVSPAGCEAVAAAGRTAYDGRTPDLHRGWQKVVLVETGLAGEQLEHHDSQRSHEIMKWSYDHCKTLGYTIDDIDTGSEMGKYMFNINQAIIATWSPGM